MLGDLYRQQHAWAQAKTWYDKALALQPTDQQTKDALAAVEASASAAASSAGK
jgi:uncharacterized protein HemY